jgi:hypothetical protein
MLDDVALESFITEAEVGSLGIKLLFLKVVAIMAVQIADGANRFDHDLKFTRRCIQPIPPEDQKTGRCGRTQSIARTLLKNSSDVEFEAPVPVPE